MHRGSILRKSRLKWVRDADAVPPDRVVVSERATLVAVDELPPLAYDHRAIVEAAVEAREKPAELYVRELSAGTR